MPVPSPDRSKGDFAGDIDMGDRGRSRRLEIPGLRDGGGVEGSFGLDHLDQLESRDAIGHVFGRRGPMVGWMTDSHADPNGGPSSILIASEICSNLPSAI